MYIVLSSEAQFSSISKNLDEMFESKAVWAISSGWFTGQALGDFRVTLVSKKFLLSFLFTRGKLLPVLDSPLSKSLSGHSLRDGFAGLELVIFLSQNFCGGTITAIDLSPGWVEEKGLMVSEAEINFLGF